MEQDQATPKPKNNTTTIVVIILVVLVVLGLSGYFASRYLVKLAGEKMAEGLITSATGGKVKVSDGGSSVKLSDGDTTVDTGDSAKWPADMPADVIKPNFGKVTMATKISSDNAWNVILSNVSADEYTAYKASLIAKGWSSDVETSFGVSIATFKKDTWDLTLSYDPSSLGLVINILPQSK